MNDKNDLSQFLIVSAKNFHNILAPPHCVSYPSLATDIKINEGVICFSFSSAIKQQK